MHNTELRIVLVKPNHRDRNHDSSFSNMNNQMCREVCERLVRECPNTPWGWAAKKALEEKTAKTTFHILAKLVGEVRCKPGWKFELINDEGAMRLAITVPGVDSFDPEHKFTVLHYHPVPTTTFNEKSWRRWIFDQCVRTETHEIGEWLRFGEGDNEIRPFLPTHGPGEDPYQNREYRDEDDAFTTQDGSMRGGVGPSGRRPELHGTAT